MRATRVNQWHYLLLPFLLFTFDWKNPAVASALYGHSLSPTIDTNAKGEASIGTYVISYGLTDNLMLASSTWMYYDYNSWTAILKKRFNDWAVQAAYIKSDSIRNNLYQMEAGLLWLGKQFTVNRSYDLTIDLNFMHFWDETVPFSLRRESGNDDPYQYSLTTLHRLKWTSSVGMLLEVGVLGLNYLRPQVHNGVSLYYQNKFLVLQLGASLTSRPYNISRLHETPSIDPIYGSADYDSSVHPEIQVQLFL